MAAGYWKGMDATIRRVLAQITIEESKSHRRVEKRELVEVLPHEQELGGNRLRATRELKMGDPIFVVDDDGQGWRGVTAGRGQPSWGFTIIPASRVEVLLSLPDRANV